MTYEENKTPTGWTLEVKISDDEMVPDEVHAIRVAIYALLCSTNQGPRRSAILPMNSMPDFPIIAKI